MLKIEINEADGALHNKEVFSKQTGEVLHFREQVAYIYNGGVYPEKIIIQLDKDESPYPAGLYTLDNSSFFVGDFCSLRIKRIKLVPLTSNSK